MHRAHQSHYFYCLKISRIGSVRTGNINWVSDQFHNAHGSVLTGLLTKIAIALAGFLFCRSLKYQEMKSIIERMVPR